MPARLVVSFLALSLLACSPGGGGGGGSSSSSGGSSDVRGFIVRVLKADCARDERCAATNGRRYTTQAVCEDAAEGFADLLMTLFEPAFNLGTAAEQDACVAEVDASACSAPGTSGPACRTALAPTQLLTNGALCHQPGTEYLGTCDVGLTCSWDMQECGHCTALSGLAGACGNDTSCQEGLYCHDPNHTGSGTCAAEKGRNAACDGYGECVGNLVCAGPSGSRTCTERVGVNAACDDATCLGDLSCAGASGSRTCVPYLALGATCTRNSEPPCGNYCVFATKDAPSGTCQTLSALPAAGQPCAYSGSYGVCANGAYPQETENSAGGQTACECQPAQPNGQPCLRDSECTSEVCVGVNYATTPTTPGACTAKLANGQECNYSDSHCQSDNCDTSVSPSVCATAPVCQ